MTVQTTTNKATFPGTGSTGPFTFNFRFFENTDIEVIRTDVTTGGETVLAEGGGANGYTLTGAGSYSGGSVTLNTALGNGTQSLTVRRILAVKQGTAFRNQGSYFAETHEDVFDRNTMVDQQQEEENARSLRVQVSSDLADLEIPGTYSAATRALKGIGFDAAGALKLYALLAGTSLVDLGDISNMLNGVALIGGAGRVVDSIAALKALPLAGSKTAFVLGYYAKGDGGGGAYYYDASDTTTADNGGTVIVATDGGRWKLAEQGVITVRQFGAKGDNTADDYQAFANAIAALAHVYVPGGYTYKIGTQLDLTGDKTITGPDGGTQAAQPAVIRFTGASGNVFSATSAEFGGVCIRNLSIIGGNGSYAIRSSRPQSLFENILMEGYVGGGIELFEAGTGSQASWGCMIRNCKWVGPTSPSAYRGYQIDINGGHVTLESCTAIYGSVGINIDQGEAINIYRCSLNSQTSNYSSESSTNGQAGIRLSGASYKKAISIRNSYIEGCTTGIYAEACTASSIVDNYFDDLGNGGAGIYLKDTNVINMTIQNNHIYQRGAGDVAIDNLAANTTIIGNYILADGGGGAHAIRSTTAAVLLNNNIAAGVTTDTNGLLQDVTPAMSSWTPTLQGATTAGSHTYAIQIGRYFKIGRRVTVEFMIQLSAKDAAMAGFVRIAGLPFTQRNYASSLGVPNIGFFDNVDLTAGYSHLGGQGVSGGTTIVLLQSGDNVASATVGAAAISSSTLISGSFSYDT